MYVPIMYKQLIFYNNIYKYCKNIFGNLKRFTLFQKYLFKEIHFFLSILTEYLISYLYLRIKLDCKKSLGIKLLNLSKNMFIRKNVFLTSNFSFCVCCKYFSYI